MSQEEYMADIINDGSQPYTQEEAEAYAGEFNAGEPVMANPMGKKKVGGGCRGPKWSSKEDECLVEDSSRHGRW
jgi:hypothetical protein